ncbi:uncharacterized protein A4U43_C10F13880 [Asparagus officinalis]|uniref:Uncharacterized protein n=1 Tax=Asparagus officinalis TaxID=4686 RepID=A0A5P1E2K0_ASPOF|nr:uncharacterized protein A4U43_C10F13880 [Asparagus officinalis]
MGPKPKMLASNGKGNVSYSATLATAAATVGMTKICSGKPKAPTEEATHEGWEEESYEGLGSFLPTQYDPPQPGLGEGQEATAELTRVEEHLEYVRGLIFERMQAPAFAPDFLSLLKA